MTPYSIRLAKQIDARAIKEIELEAARRFAGLNLVDHLLEHHFDQELLRVLISDKQVWIACEVSPERMAEINAAAVSQNTAPETIGENSENAKSSENTGRNDDDGGADARDHRRYAVQRRKLRRKPAILDPPVGFAIATVMGPLAYLEELDVMTDHGRQGLGRKLIEAVAEWASKLNFPHITLSTFRYVAWNAPFYERVGFSIMSEDELEEELLHIRALELKLGLPVEQRVFMRMNLQADSAAP